MREGITFETMNTRLEIASRMLAGMMADPSVAGDHNTLPDLALKYADALIAAEERIKELEGFVRDVRDNWDCDTGANGAHHYCCRACSALKPLPKEEPK